MVTYQGDTQDSTIRATDYVAFPEGKEYNAKGNFIFWVLKKTSDGNNPLFLNDPKLNEDKTANIKAFGEISFYQETRDKAKGTYKRDVVPARQCVADDFCLGDKCTEESTKYFKGWAGYSLICPDLSGALKEFKVNGDPSKSSQERMVF